MESEKKNKKIEKQDRGSKKERKPENGEGKE